MHHLLIAVTGTPGVGKSTFAKKLSARMEGAALVEINDIVDKYELYASRDEFGTKIVNLGKLNEIFKKELKKKRRSIIIVGHLAPELKLKYDIAIVLRCGLRKLSLRLEKRGYQRKKLAENLVSESVDYCGINVAKKARDTYEVETTAEQKAIADYVVSVSRGEATKKPTKIEISKLKDLIEMTSRGNKYGL